jgi:hypothetical protein
MSAATIGNILDEAHAFYSPSSYLFLFLFILFLFSLSLSRQLAKQGFIFYKERGKAKREVKSRNY